MEETKMSNKVKQLRKEYGLTQEELAHIAAYNVLTP